ncbi:hypothetical protein [Agreia sp. VKM Ac-1783]|uniref:hypothetical protein n=1 Tax=Agreia sp. VKM Ac-1783 TaxID=1938889 RepID=UPI000A2ADE4F|nr:hypothetical protein [Agreia sp. VKM Ac-1783]SMQ73742.1 hypothetical protein SAMN06295943_2981 [Agreia sp. VKM Ac-1783]
MAAGPTEESQARDLHLHATASEKTLIRLWEAGYGGRLRGLGDQFQVVFDGDGVRLYDMAAPIEPGVAANWRAFIPWSEVDRVGLATVTMPGLRRRSFIKEVFAITPRSPIMRDAITITARSVTIPLLVYPASVSLESIDSGQASLDTLGVARAVNALRGTPTARLNPSDLWREEVPEFDPNRKRLAADPDLPSRTADELLGDAVRREPVYGSSSARIQWIWRVVGGLLLVSGIVVVIGSLVNGSEFVRGLAIVAALACAVTLRTISIRKRSPRRIMLEELEAGYTLWRSGPVQVDQLDPATSIVIRRAGERALTRREQRRARAAARLLDAGGPELPASEWAVLRARQIVSGGEDPAVQPQPTSELRGEKAAGTPVWGTGAGEPVPARYPLLAGRHSRSIAWYRRADVRRRRAAEHEAGYTVSRTLRPDLDQVDPVTGYVIRPAGQPALTRAQERAAAARVRMLPR